MKGIVGIVIALLVVLSLLVACAPATPTAAPTKPAAAATTAPVPAATAATAPGVATKPAAAAAATSAPVAKIKRGGTLRQATSWSVAHMDPASSLNMGTTNLMLFDHLLGTERNPQSGEWKFVPEVASSWEWKDSKTLIFKLEKGIKFHDGTNLDAAGVKWSLERARDWKESRARNYVNNVTSIDAIDDTTVQLKTSSTNAALLSYLSKATYETALVPRSAVEKMGDTEFSTKPVGSGPMQYVSWTRDDKVELKKFPGYWKKGADGQPLPYLDTYTWRYVTDPAVSILELKAGNLEMIDDVEAKDAVGLKGQPNVEYVPFDWVGSFYFTWGFNMKKAPFGDNLKLRQAFQYAIDRDSMAKALGFGISRPHSYPYWTQGMLGYDETLPKYAYDEAKAKQLLAEAGYANGINLNMMVINRAAEMRIGEMAKSMLDKVGIRTTLDVFERLATISKAQSGDFQVYFWRPNNQMDTETQPARELMTGTPNNWINLSIPEFDVCMREGREELDPTKRHEIYKRCQKVLYDTAYIGAGFFEPKNEAVSKKVKGLRFQWNMRDAREAWIDN